MTACVVPNCKVRDSGERVSLHLFPDPSREPERHIRWIRAINSEKIYNREPIVVFKQLRVCRKHFEDNSFNGSCKKLLQTAIPTLNLDRTDVTRFKTKLLAYENKIASLLKQNSIDIVDDQLQLVGEVMPSSTPIQISKTTKVIDEDDEENYELMEIEDQTTDIFSGDKKFKLVLKTSEKVTEKVAPKPIIKPLIRVAQKKYMNRKIKQSLAPLTIKSLLKLRNEFYNTPKLELAQNICTKVDPLEAAISRARLESTSHVFQYTVEFEAKPMCDQKSTGRCWNFAVHNAMRIPFMKQWNIEEFEFSQAHFFYWDKIERSYYFLNNIVETAKRGEDVNGRLVSFLLSDPIGDGGQWDMIVNIINKHGVMPKKCFPESFSSESSGRMNAILKSKLREYAKIIRELFTAGTAESEIQAKVDQQMHEIYNIVGICLGIPPITFTWEYYDKNKKYNNVGPISGVEFYEKLVKPYFNVEDKVCLVTDPRPSNEFGKGYTVDCLGNVVGGRPVFYNNQPVDVLIDLVAKSLKDGEPVWFGCDVGARFARYQGGADDLEILDYKTVFNVDVALGLSKADRLIYGDSLMTHAMVFTGFGTDDKGNVTKFRVENSWGEARGGEKGYLLMTADWFRQYGYEAVIDKKHVSDEILKVFNTKPIVLPAWDPMGSLAQ